MPTVRRPDGVTIAYADTGGAGPTVVFSHGILMDGSMFDAQVADLSPDYRCISWDARGHGATGPVTTPFTFWDSAADLLAVLDDAGVDTAVLVGMSQGGFASLRAALAAPERVRGLVCIDSQAGLEDEDAAPLYRSMAENWATEGYDEATAAFVAELILGKTVDPGPWLSKWRALPKEQVLQPTYTLLERDDLTGRLSEINAPALVIHGTADAAIPMERAAALADGLPGCGGVVEIPDAGHASNVSHPAPVNGALRDFLRACR
jgi:pimeloyl-ACP methyl ester carboxylesterase